MSKVKVSNFTISLDGFGAGKDQNLHNPLGKGGEKLHTWMLSTKRFQEMSGGSGGTEGMDNDLVERSFENVGAWIMGRNMFGPVRGKWPDEEWKGWWGDEPPYHVPVYVLTHFDRQPLKMKGGTTFYFVTTGIESALEQARKAASGKDIRIGGGASTIRQFLQAGLVDEIQLAISPVFLGSGEHFFADLDMTGLGYQQIQKIEGESATHIFISK